MDDLETLLQEADHAVEDSYRTAGSAIEYAKNGNFAAFTAWIDQAIDYAEVLPSKLRQLKAATVGKGLASLRCGEEKPIEWEPLSEDSFNPAFSGYTAAPYCTDAPQLGFCLYLRDGRGTWNQRTKPMLPPAGSKAHPVFVNGKWWWRYES